MRLLNILRALLHNL